MRQAVTINSVRYLTIVGSIPKLAVSQSRVEEIMRTHLTIVTAAFFGLTTVNVALADTDHGHGFKAKGVDLSSSSKHTDMRQMMMRMHSRMMADHPMGNIGMMTGSENGLKGQTESLDRTMMRLMAKGFGMMQQPSASGLKSMLQSSLQEYDENSDEALSIEEFQTLYSAMIREDMVDRFQHLDADGDGQITSVEMRMPAERFEMRMMEAKDPSSEMMPGNGKVMGEE